MHEERRALAFLFKGVGVEIGTERGIYAKMIMVRGKPEALFCIDSWKVYGDYRHHISQQKQNRLYLEARDRLQEFPNCILIRKFSMDAVKDFGDNTLDFVYIDANHEYKYVKEDIEEWARKVKKGGIIAGHDYLGEVKKAVDEYAQAHGITTIHIYQKKEVPSWMFYV